MKLLTHNMLTSKCLKGVVTGYPLSVVVCFIHHFDDTVNGNGLNRNSKCYFLARTLCFQVREIRVQESEFNKEFISRLIPKLEWNVFWSVAKQVNANSHLRGE